MKKDGIEGGLMKSSDKIKNCCFEEKVDFKVKMAEKDVKLTICYIAKHPVDVKI